jgi:hypothetical protein
MLQSAVSASLGLRLYFITHLNYQEHLQDAAFLLLKESRVLERNPMTSKGSPLHGPQVRLTEQAHRLFAETKEHVFESKASEEHAKLLRYAVYYNAELVMWGRKVAISSVLGH